MYHRHFSGDENYFTGPSEAEVGLVASPSLKSRTHHQPEEAGQKLAQSGDFKL